MREWRGQIEMRRTAEGAAAAFLLLVRVGALANVDVSGEVGEHPAKVLTAGLLAVLALAAPVSASIC